MKADPSSLSWNTGWYGGSSQSLELSVRNNKTESGIRKQFHLKKHGVGCEMWQDKLKSGRYQKDLLRKA